MKMILDERGKKHILKHGEEFSKRFGNRQSRCIG